MNTLLHQARAATANRQPEIAIPLWQQLLNTTPDLAEGWRALSICHIQSGALIEATVALEQLIELAPRDIAAHQQLGKVLQQISSGADGIAALQQVITRVPYAWSSLLVLARGEEVAGDGLAALGHYQRAIKTAELRGFWLNDDSTAPWARALLKHGRETLRRGRYALCEQWLAPLYHHFGRDEMRRVSDCVAMFTGVKPLTISDSRQQPGFLYFPGLPESPQFDVEHAPFAADYRHAAPAIRDELAAVLAGSADVKPFHHGINSEALSRGGDWDAYFFYRHGQRQQPHHDDCPVTASAIDALPLCRIGGHSPEVCFSIMRPGAHILPHRGVTNIRAVLHLGLMIPDGCALNLPGIANLQWQPGQIFAFDDTYEHEAWNRSDQLRAVLLADIWNPHLTAAEQQALKILVEQIGHFDTVNRAWPLAAPVVQG